MPIIFLIFVKKNMTSLFPDIVSDPEVLNGKPCIKGTRISVELIMDWVRVVRLKVLPKNIRY
jgi:uncharacterized protein (DUF433 family)